MNATTERNTRQQRIRQHLALVTDCCGQLVRLAYESTAKSRYLAGIADKRDIICVQWAVYERMNSRSSNDLRKTWLMQVLLL